MLLLLYPAMVYKREMGSSQVPSGQVGSEPGFFTALQKLCVSKGEMSPYSSPPALNFGLEPDGNDSKCFLMG